MRTVLAIASVYVLLIAVFGYLFGQAFFGRFSVIASVAGLSGILAALAGLFAVRKIQRAQLLPLWFSLAAVFGVVLDVANYYLHLIVAGNYYAWPLVVPYCAALTFIAYFAWHSKRQTNSEFADSNGA